MRRTVDLAAEEERLHAIFELPDQEHLAVEDEIELGVSHARSSVAVRVRRVDAA